MLRYEFAGIKDEEESRTRKDERAKRKGTLKDVRLALDQ
jgi:hypothetical protein